MDKYKIFKSFQGSFSGLLLTVIVGITGYAISVCTRSPYADPLVVSMVLGIIIRTGMKEENTLKAGFSLAPSIFIPIGVAFYAAKNLNFVKFATVPKSIIVLLLVIMIVYFAVILILGKILKQKKEITYLVATGSAICGASAIAMTSPAVEAESDDVSISLIAVALAASVGLFILLPFLAILFGMTGKVYGILSASVLQFTGFVKAAAGNIPCLEHQIATKDLVSLALSIKAVRYLGLLIAVPLFASLAKRKLYIPWFLWLFLAAGIGGSLVYYANAVFFNETLIPFIKPIYNISWSIALAAVGLNADVRQLLSNNGAKALIMAFAGFFIFIFTFLIGYCCFNMSF